MNSILLRRRAMMAGSSNVDNTIYGSRLTWIQGGIDASTGAPTTSEYVIATVDYIPFSDKKVLTYTGPATNINGVVYFVYAALYDSNFNFLKRELIYYTPSHITTFQVVNQSVGYIKISYGHNAGTEEPVDPSEGSEFVCLVQDRSEVKNGFEDGSYTAGSTSMSISNNILSISKWSGGASANHVTLRFKYPLNIQTGDTVRIVVNKTAGTMSAAQYCNISVGGNTIISNKLWDKGSTAIDLTNTSPGNANNLAFVPQNRTSTASFTGYKCSVKVYVNSIQVLPEV